MKLYIYSLIFFISTASPVQAKWATLADAPIKTSYKQTINVDQNGLSKTTNEIEIEILKEPGRNIAAQYTLKYNGDSEQIKILAAKTLYKGKEYHLAKNLIEDKPLASAPQGFDQIRQVLLAFPKPEIGAKIYLKYQLFTTKIPLDRFFASLFYFGNKEFVTDAVIKLHSQLPLHILVNDPEKALQIDTDKKDNFHKLEITLLKPLYKDTINEPIFAMVNKKFLTWVSVSSLTKWHDLAVRLGKSYAKVFTTALPHDFQLILQKAEQKTSPAAQINSVTSMVNDKIQYLGDWRTVKGRYIPRPLMRISDTQLGDCKDFAAATAAILAKLGYKVQFALVKRGVYDFPPHTLPDLAAFNHAMLKVTSPEGQVYWLDPTNFQSMAGGIFPDIANKNALVLDPQAPSYEKIPNINPEHAQMLSNRNIEILPDNSVQENGTITLKNEEAYAITGAALQTSEETIKDLLFYYLSKARLEQKNKKILDLPDLKSRIVKDIIFTYSFTQANKVIKTNMGPALKLDYDSLLGFFEVSPDCVSDILFDIPHTTKKQTVIKNIKVQDVSTLNKAIQSPWVHIARRCTMRGNDLYIDDTIIIHKNLISSSDLKSPEFAKLKDELEKNFKEVALVFTPFSPEQQQTRTLNKAA